MKTNWLTHQPRDEREELLILRAQVQAFYFLVNALALAGITIYVLFSINSTLLVEPGLIIILIAALFLGVVVTGKNAIGKDSVEMKKIDLRSMKYPLLTWVIGSALILIAALIAGEPQLLLSPEYMSTIETIHSSFILISAIIWIWYSHRFAPVYYKIFLSFPLVTIPALGYFALGENTTLKGVLRSVFVIVLPLLLSWAIFFAARGFVE